MNLRRMILGDPNGQTAFQKMKAKWDDARVQEELQLAFSTIANPLNLKWGDKLEIFGFEDVLLEVGAVENCLIEGAEAKDAKMVRYHLREVGGDHELHIEAICNGDEVEYALFEIAEEFEFDEGLTQIIDTEDVLRQSFEDDHGKPGYIDYEKENDFAMELEGFHEEGTFKTRMRVIAYFYENPDGDEEYLSVEINDSDGWTTLYLGRAIMASEITSFGG